MWRKPGPRSTSRTCGASVWRKATTLTAFRKELEQHSGVAEQIEEFYLDMWPPYLKGIGETFPEASVTFDKFHVMKILKDAVDQVRRAEQRIRPELRGSRYVWTKNPENLSPKQFALWSELDVKRLNLKTARAYHMRLAFQELYTMERNRAAALLSRWYFWATHAAAWGPWSK